MKKNLPFLAVILLLSINVSWGQPQEPAEHVVTFRFVPGKDMFYIPWSGNDAELNRLYTLVDKYRAEISHGRVPVYVDAYCALPSRRETTNRQTAYLRACRVKSELITNKGLVEHNFRTRNYPAAYTDPSGVTHKDIVIVTLRIPVKPQPEPEPQVEVEIVESEPLPVVKEEPVTVVEPQPQTEPVVIPEPADLWKHPYCFAVRTNLLYDALLLPTLGVEWRVNRHIGIKLDGSFAHWGNSHGKVQKVWALSPEVRWYLTPHKQFYVGLGGNYADYNIYKYVLGKVFSSDTGYQGTLWSAGAVVGYQLSLSRSFAIDFNLGLGYTRSKYDSFTITSSGVTPPVGRAGGDYAGDDMPGGGQDIRLSKDRGKTKNFWGPTQAGVSLIWKIGGKE